MQREEKALEAATEALAQRVSDLKNAIAKMILKLEHQQDTVNWPSLLDSFGLLTGELNSLLKTIKNDKTPMLRNYAILPLMLNPERDDALIQLTEGRIPVFNHEVVPHALRTKPEPGVEEFQRQLENRMNQGNTDTMQKQINTMNKICTHVLESISNHSQDREAGIPAPAQTSNIADTHLLVASVSTGRGLKTAPGQMPGGPPTPQMGDQPRMGGPQMGQGPPGMGMGQRPMGMMGPGQAPMKMPNIRTNIRVAAPNYGSR